MRSLSDLSAAIKVVLRLEPAVVREMAEVCRQEQFQGNVGEVYAQVLRVGMAARKEAPEAFWEV